MQAYEGYFENGRFFPIGPQVSIPGRRHVIVAVLDEPAQRTDETAQAAAWREFFDAVNASDEEIPETFERVNFTRKVDL
jgi:hypothetical protein